MNIIITSGPTNEPIDAVMKITNMSTGSLGARIAEVLLNTPEYERQVEKLYFVTNRTGRRPVIGIKEVETSKMKEIVTETTDDLLQTLKHLLTNMDEHIDAVIHSAAVGDYTGRYAIRGEDLADAILAAQNEKGRELSHEELMEIISAPPNIENTATKISSYEPNLMVMLGLTPKVIGHIKAWSPDTTLIGFKLLGGVTKGKLFDVAAKLRVKNHADFIMANDLAEIHGDKHWGMIVGDTGVVCECETKSEIAMALARLALAANRIDLTGLPIKDSRGLCLNDEQKLVWPWWNYKRHVKGAADNIDKGTVGMYTDKGIVGIGCMKLVDELYPIKPYKDM